MFDLNCDLLSTSVLKKTGAEDQQLTLKDKCILFIEDDYVNYLYFKELLSEAGWSILRALTLSQALHLFTVNSNIGLVVLSASLPENINNEVLRFLKSKYPFLPIITIINNNLEYSEDRCLLAVSDTCVNHHTDSAHFIEVIKEFLEKDTLHCGPQYCQ
jgi:CheY-like chemotaxis protein